MYLYFTVLPLLSDFSQTHFLKVHPNKRRPDTFTWNLCEIASCDSGSSPLISVNHHAADGNWWKSDFSRKLTSSPPSWYDKRTSILAGNERDIPDRRWHPICNTLVRMAPNPLTPDQPNPPPHGGFRVMRPACLLSGYSIGLAEGGHHHYSDVFSPSPITSMNCSHNSFRLQLHTQVGLHFRISSPLCRTLCPNGHTFVILSAGTLARLNFYLHIHWWKFTVI